MGCPLISHCSNQFTERQEGGLSERSDIAGGELNKYHRNISLLFSLPSAQAEVVKRHERSDRERWDKSGGRKRK